MQSTILLVIMLFAAASAAMAQSQVCGGNVKKLEMLYAAAVATGGQAENAALAQALFPISTCLADKGALPASGLKGKYAIYWEIWSALSGTTITLVTDAEISAIARRLPKSKSKCPKKAACGGCVL